MADNQGDTSGCEDSFEPPSGPTRSRRACDACHARKIRCNKESPCAYCSRTGIVCTFAAGQSREKRTRILLTPQYERKFDHMDRRLDDIVKLLEELKANMLTNSQPSSNSAQPPESSSTPVSIKPGHFERSVEVKNTKHSSQSDSTLALHSEFAHDFMQKTITANPSVNHNPEMRSVFDALKDIVRAFKPASVSTEISYPHAAPFKRPSLRGCEMPPIEKVVELLRHPNYQRVTRFMWIFQFIQMESFSDLCLAVYFSQECSETDFVTVNVGLYYLFQEVMETEQDQRLQFADMCRNNIDTSLSILPLYLPPNFGTVVALLCGIYYAADISQPNLAWTLVAKASEICQTNGYHHAGSKGEDSKEHSRRKQQLFWFLYIIDKSMSLRLGRASTIQDWDVTIPLPTPTSDDQASHQSLLSFLGLIVKAARCQGNIHELLLSSTSLALPDHIRHSRVQIIENQLEEFGEELKILKEKQSRMSTDAEMKDPMKFLLLSQEVVHMSLHTLVYRAAQRLATSSAFSEQCMTKARSTLERLECYLEMIKAETERLPAMIYSPLLYAPIPFLAMFCHIIETLNHSDLARLRDFNALLLVVTPSSGPVPKMQRLFQALYNVAKQYFELRTAPSGEEQMHASAEMDSYLSMLGVSTVDSGGQQQQQQADGLGQSIDHAPPNILEDSRNRNESMNPLVWMDNMLQPDDLLFW